MNNNNLLASIAVFGELCNTEQDVQSIIIEFIKSIYALEKSWAFTTIDVTNHLKKHFDFDFPEAVVKFCLNQMRKNGQVERATGQYRLTETNYDSEGLTKKIDDKRKLHGSIHENLIEFYESTQNSKANASIKKELIQNFLSYLFDNGVDDKYSTVINTFILKNSNDNKFKETLNQIKEGIIITTGLKYTSDITSLGKWTDELNIYLETEIIFNAFGFNGEVYKKLFDDFFSLVNEINHTSLKSKGSKLIKLRYFESTKQEIDDFFHGAQRIIKKEQNIAPLSTAMFEICKGCATIDDIIFKKSKLETDLISMGIRQVSDPNYLEKPDFIIESSELIEKHSKSTEEENVANILETFSRINFLRKGRNRTSFEKCKHIILTGKNLSLHLSKDSEIKDEAKSIPFSTDIYFITNRFWFKLNKGFSKKDDIPATLDMITKARIILSSQINSSVKSKYKALIENIESGELTNLQAQDYYYHLRENAKKPEDLSSENINKSVNFIFDDSFDIYEREQAYKNQQIKDGKIAIEELKGYKRLERVNKNKSIKRKIRKEFILRSFAFYFLLIIGIGLIAYFLSFLISHTDSLFSILIGCITILAFVLPHLKKGKINKIREKSKRKVCKKHFA